MRRWSWGLRTVLDAIVAAQGDVKKVALLPARHGGRMTSQGFRAAWARAMREFVGAGGVRFRENDIRAKTASDASSHAAPICSARSRRTDPLDVMSHAVLTRRGIYKRDTPLFVRPRGTPHQPAARAAGEMGWRMGLEPTTTGITIRTIAFDPKRESAVLSKDGNSASR